MFEHSWCSALETAECEGKLTEAEVLAEVGSSLSSPELTTVRV